MPRWPKGFLGTISHAGGLCIAHVARSVDLAGIGIDLEVDNRLTPELADLTCRPDERRLDETSGLVDTALARFVAKEAFFKAYFPATRTFLDFDELRVTLDPDCIRFVAELTNEASPGLNGARRFSGRIAVLGNVAIAGVWIATNGRNSG